MSTFEAICFAVTWFFILTFGTWSMVGHYVSKIEKKIDKLINLYDMTIIEQIKAEIESRKKSLRAGICNEEVFTRKQRKEMLVASEELDRLNRFLSILEEKSEKPIVSNGLKEAAREYAKTTFKKPHSDNPDEEVTIVEPDKYVGFIAGAKWDKEQMMSNAVECIVEDWNPEPHPEITIPLNPEEFSNGDRVRIIIVKEAKK